MFFAAQKIAATHSLRVQVAADAADAPFSPEGDGEGPEAGPSGSVGFGDLMTSWGFLIFMVI